MYRFCVTSLVIVNDNASNPAVAELCGNKRRVIKQRVGDFLTVKDIPVYDVITSTLSSGLQR